MNKGLSSYCFIGAEVICFPASYQTWLLVTISKCNFSGLIWDTEMHIPLSLNKYFKIASMTKSCHKGQEMKKSEHLRFLLPLRFNVHNLSLGKEIPQILCIVAPYPLGLQIEKGVSPWQMANKVWPQKHDILWLLCHDSKGLKLRRICIHRKKMRYVGSMKKSWVNL